MFSKDAAYPWTSHAITFEFFLFIRQKQKMTRGTDGRVRLTRTEDDNGLNTLNRKQWRYIVQHSIYWSVRERRGL